MKNRGHCLFNIQRVFLKISTNEIMGQKRPSFPPVRYSDGFIWGNLTAAIIKAGTYNYSGAPNFTPVFQ
jgi:hypothetical protein